MMERCSPSQWEERSRVVLNKVSETEQEMELHSGQHRTKASCEYVPR